MAGSEKQHIKDHLPKHEPAESVWEKIDAKLQEEIGDDSISKAGNLKGFLPQHQPQDDLWNAISHQLDTVEIRDNLPKHEPSEALWTKLEAKIEEPVRKRNSILKWAAILVLALGSALVFNNLSNDKPKLEYHVEWDEAPEPTRAEDDRTGSEGIAGNDLIEQLCQRSKTVCETPEFKNLEEELKQLESDRAEIEAQINPYADNTKLERMLVHIELEHSKIVNEMTRKLL